VRNTQSEARHQEWFHRVGDWITFGVALLLACVQLYRAVTAGTIGDDTSLRNFGIALALLAGVGLYFTDYWRPVLYLLGAIFAGTLTVFWGLRSPVTMSLETSRLALGIALFVACIAQFFGERFVHQNPTTSEPAFDENDY
jgi:hypothetical protein